MFKIVSKHRTALNRQVREAVRIRRRGGAEGGVLNSKSEFNRSHIPRMIVEVEEDDKKARRLELEQADKEEIERILENMDLTWEERKSRARELAEKKRRRLSDIVEEGAKPKKRRKKMKYTMVDDTWGEEEHETQGEPRGKHVGGGEESKSNECDLVTGGARKKQRLSQLTPSLITEYFPKIKRMENCGAFGEEDWFDTWASEYRGMGGEEHTGSTTETGGRDAQLPSVENAPGIDGDSCNVTTGSSTVGNGAVEREDPGRQGAEVTSTDRTSTIEVQAALIGNIRQ